MPITGPNYLYASQIFSFQQKWKASFSASTANIIIIPTHRQHCLEIAVMHHYSKTSGRYKNTVAYITNHFRTTSKIKFSYRKVTLLRLWYLSKDLRELGNKQTYVYSRQEHFNYRKLLMRRSCEVGTCLACLRNSKEVSIARTEWVRGRVEADGSQRAKCSAVVLKLTVAGEQTVVHSRTLSQPVWE